MAITIGPVTLPRAAAELLDTTDGYGAGAKIWLESSADGSTGWTPVTSEVLIAGIEAVYFRDPSGTSTTWYRTYLSKSDASQPSAYSAAFLTGSVSGYTNLFRAKTYLGISDEVDDARLPLVVNAVNAELVRRTGVFYGPSTDTVRLYDGHDTILGGTRLPIPGGIRSLTGVRLGTNTGDALTAATLADFQLRPTSLYLRPGQPFRYVAISGPSLSRFTYGYGNIELTGTFGPANVYDDLAGLADMLVTRMWADRNAGSLSAPTPSKFLYADDIKMLDFYWTETYGLSV